MFAKQRGPLSRRPMGHMHGYSHPYHPGHPHGHPYAPPHPQQQWHPQPAPRQQAFRPGPQRRPLQDNFQQQQKPKMQAKEFFTAPFTDHEGKFDIGRTANTVDQLVKTFQQVSPYVAKVGGFFIK
ncbi:YppG family protein [Shouchella lonarensis]|uniref:YppG-like protein n=1 Tax=Shouchella lonarensis TaxID=1464122 RepID=A0A1G6HC28_9BACI|nr:YppG family protein [Shouchella lonarensis]SDB91751.1 YppG-like protein [Shouchella lonarensis]